MQIKTSTWFGEFKLEVPNDYVVNMSGFTYNHVIKVGGRTVKSYFQDPHHHVLVQHWKSVSVVPCKHCNWWLHETTWGFEAACANGPKVRVDLKSAPDNKGGRLRLMLKTRPRSWVRSALLVRLRRL